jgi:hypothetical protein
LFGGGVSRGLLVGGCDGLGEQGEVVGGDALGFGVLVGRQQRRCDDANDKRSAGRPEGKATPYPTTHDDIIVGRRQC